MKTTTKFLLAALLVATPAVAADDRCPVGNWGSVECAESTRVKAKQGESWAQFNLGLQYEYGLGVEKDENEAMRWYRAAAKQGYARAQWFLDRIIRKRETAAKGAKAAKAAVADKTRKIEAEAAKKLWENGEVNIWLDDKSLHPQVQKYAESVAKRSSNCPKILWVDQSAAKKGQFYVVCSNNNKVYFTKKDLAKNAVKTVPKHLSDAVAIRACERLVKKRLDLPSSFDRHFLDTAATRVGNSRTRVEMGFSFKSAIGLELEGKVHCLLGHDVAEITNWAGK